MKTETCPKSGAAFTVYGSNEEVEETFDCVHDPDINLLYRVLFKKYDKQHGGSWMVDLRKDKVTVHGANPAHKIVVRKKPYNHTVRFSAYTKTGVGGFRIAEEVEAVGIPLVELADANTRIEPAGESQSRSNRKWQLESSKRTHFIPWQEIFEAFEEMGKVVPKEDVLGQMARAIKSQFKNVVRGGIQIKVRSKSCKANESPKFTNIIFSLKWEGEASYGILVEPVKLRVEEDTCYMTRMSNMWTHEQLPWPPWGPGGKGREFKLSDPDSLSKIKQAAVESILAAIKASIPALNVQITEKQAVTDSMRKFLTDLENYE
jgi:hypothetical protein